VYRKYGKRPIDFICALLALIVLSPLLLLAALLIKLTSKGPVFYTQKRVGIGCKEIKIYKFRSMVVGADRYAKTGIEVLPGDARVTAVGKLIRRTKIDELPQLFNILRGDLSIIGPRPTLFTSLDVYEEWEKERFSVVPGLSGLAQVNGNIYLTREGKSYFDIQYIRTISFWGDIKIIFKTFGVIIFGEEKYRAEVPVESKEGAHDEVQVDFDRVGNLH